MLLPYGDRLLKYFPDPFDFEKIGAVAAKIIADRTKVNGHSKGQRKDMLQLMLDAKDRPEEEKLIMMTFWLKVWCSFWLVMKLPVPLWGLFVITSPLTRTCKTNWETRLTVCGLETRYIAYLKFVRAFAIFWTLTFWPIFTRKIQFVSLPK